MQYLSDELLRAVSNRLKVSEYDKPNYRIEVDRLVFIPGRVENLQFINEGYKPRLEILQQWFEPIEGVYEGSTTTSPYSMTFPVPSRSMSDITARFGEAGAWIGGYHKGLDIAANIGEEIVAVLDGIVQRVEATDLINGHGLSVIVDHGEVTTRYSHMSKISVKSGEAVRRGQKIGEVGNTGYVLYNNEVVTSQQREQGLGAHLHFEVLKAGTDTILTNQDPELYLGGSVPVFGASQNTGASVVTAGSIEGTPGEVRFEEKFLTRDWYTPGNIFPDPNFINLSTPPDPSTAGSVRCHSITFTPEKLSSDTTAGFEISVNMQRQGFLDVEFYSSLLDGNEFIIYVNGQVASIVRSYEDSLDAVKGVYIPAGAVTVRLEIKWKMSEWAQTFSFAHIKIQELVVEQSSISTGGGSGTSISDFVFSNSPEQYSLQVGQFTYMDTLILDNVTSIEIDDQFESESRECRITISNPDGYYSPDFNPYYFPESYKDTPWSYSAGGFRIGALSENVPIRIFLGYGSDTMRVFTGLIDKVDLIPGSMTIYCRDMFKKISNKVLTVRKAYPDAVNPATASSSWRDEIIITAKKKASEWGVDYKLLLAIAQQETVMGTQGAGTPEAGGFVLGYGKPDPAYAGVANQMHYGAKRIAEALASRGKVADSWDDIEYLRVGGDLGTAYTWTNDPWTDGVWSIYQDIQANPSAWQESAGSNFTPTSGNQVYWLKSAVVQDLINHAGMYGWRDYTGDKGYLDALIEETYLIQVDQKKGMVVQAKRNKEGEFEVVPMSSIPTPQGWLNPFVELGLVFEPYKYKISDCIAEVIQDTNYRAYCDRYGTFRLEQIKLNRPMVATFTENENLISLTKAVDYSRCRSHLVIFGGDGRSEHFIDKEILMELKGEVRSAVVDVPWAKSVEEKKMVAERLFFDMKRLSRTLQVSIIGNPALDVLDRVMVINKDTTTRSVYTIKGIRTNYSLESGFVQMVDLMWAMDGTVM